VSIWEAVTRLVASLAWPMTAFTALIVLRRPLRALLGRVVSYEGPIGKVGFGKQIVELERLDEERKLAAAANDTESVEASAANRGRADELGALAQLAEISPAALVMMGWKDVERTLFGLYQAAGLEDKTRRVGTSPLRSSPPGAVLIGAVSKAGLVTAELTDTLHSLRKLRNDAVHELDTQITSIEALSYADIASSVAKQLQNIRHRRFPDSGVSDV